MAAALALGAAAVQAGDYPGKPIRLLCPFPPGGSNDLIARIIAQRLDASWNQRVVVDNRPGGNGVIATQLAAHAASDGYTILLVPAAHAINATLMKNLPYDPVRDFAPVTEIASAPNVLVVHPSVPAKSLPEFIALAKARPGQLYYGSAGIGFPSHLAGEMLKSMAGIDIVHVPYKGAGPAMADLIGGQITASFPSVPGALPHIKAGRLRALAVTSDKRSAVMPEVPTIGETLPGYSAGAWFGIVAPAGTPHAIVTKLNAEIVRVTRLPAVMEQLLALGADPVGSSPAEFEAYLKSEIAKWAGVIKRAGVRAE